jgi:hypothetical protein
MMAIGRRARVAGFLCALAIAAAAVAHAGPSISSPRTSPRGTSVANPRHANARFDADSAYVRKSEFGVLFGTPAGLNAEFGWWPGPRVGYRVSGLYLGRSLTGVQGNLCVTLARHARRREALALVGGWLGSNEDDFRYGGVAFDWNVAPLYLEFGLVVGSGDLEIFQDEGWQPTLIAQLGLMVGGGVFGPR